MARLFVFGIGGTGSRVIKSLIMLLSAGIKPGDFDEVIPIIIDPHKDLKELNDCKRLIRLYSDINRVVYGDNSKITDGYFRTKVSTLKTASTDKSLKDDIDFDEGSKEPFQDFISLGKIKKLSPTTKDLLSLLYSEQNFKQPLNVGFKGNPHMGSMALNSLFGGRAFRTFKSIYDNDDRIFIISSVFGGTGAAGFPLLLKNLRQNDNPAIRDCQIGALSVLPYFKLKEAKETSDIDSNDFMTKTKSALTYYNNPDFMEQYNSLYYIADLDGQTEGYENNEKTQPNKAHLVELLGAISIVHFAKRNNHRNGEVKEYCIGGNVQGVNFKNIGNTTRNMIKTKLTTLHLLSKIHTEIKENCKNLSFCKANDFSTNFFQNDFFADEENGLEIFLNEFYSKWISELEKNQRSFIPFNLKVNKSFNHLVYGNESEKRLFDGYFSKPVDKSDLLNRISKTTIDKDVRLLKDSLKYCQYLTMCWLGSTEFVQTNFKSQDNGKL